MLKWQRLLLVVKFPILSVVSEVRKPVLGLVPVSVFEADSATTKNGALLLKPSNKDGGDGPANDAAASAANAEKGKKNADEMTKRAHVEAIKSRSKLLHAISSGNIGGGWDRQRCIRHNFRRAADSNTQKEEEHIWYFSLCVAPI